MRLFLVLLIAGAVAYGQRPVISPGGIVNAASYATGGLTGKAVAGGSIVSIFGRNLAAATQSASGVPLPTSLAGASVSVNGIPAPIFYVSPGQINIQLPSSYPLPFSGLEVVVMTPAGSSDPVSLELRETFGIFTMDASGCGQGAVLNVGSDGSVSLNSPGNSASPGDLLAVYGTGLGATFNPPADGSPAPSGPLALALNWGVLSATFDFGPPAGGLMGGGRPFWAGRAPGLVGVDQVNVQIPETVREGCAVPVTINSGGRSQPVTISIRRGGGACVDPPTAGYGQITWEKTIASGTTPSGETDTLTAAFPASPGKRAPAQVQFQQGGGSSNVTDFFGPSCPLPGYRNLNAGTVRAQGPGFGPVEAVVDGQTAYRALFPNGTIRAGSFSVTATGGGDVGSFQSALRIGSGINITSSFPPGTILRTQATGGPPITVNWTGGDPDTWVTLKVISHLNFADKYSFVQARTANGTVTIGTLGLVPGPGEIIVELTPDPAQVPAFSAAGLSLGGQHLWKYTYRFGGLMIQ